MPGIKRPLPHTCARCLRARPPLGQSTSPFVRPSSSTTSPPESRKDDGSSDIRAEADKGAMSRRLAEMSDESLESGGRSAKKAVEEAGFSEDLKRQLEEKLANASFRSENASAFAQANMPESAGRGTRDIAGAQPWTGTESDYDASLRMMNDAYKPMKVPSKIPGIRGPPRKVDTGRSKTKAGTGTRLANARDRTSYYSFLKDPEMPESDKEKMRKEMKERFQPGARSVPATIQGLASLANERIEDAIARGQFKNLPRGKKIERDYNASSPFLDTTEYFMNKIIQRQEIVPPWIEKQQELVSTSTKFRSRLRADWRRHVARVISSRGGSLESKMKLADEYAFAESIENPPKRKVEQLAAVTEDGHMSQITLSGELKPNNDWSTGSEREAIDEGEIKIVEQALGEDGTGKLVEGEKQEEVTVFAEQSQEGTLAQASIQTEMPQEPVEPRRATVSPFRDQDWEDTERSYHNAAIKDLNSLARSYNLMAPNLAKKPYFYLDRELKACYADVAPQVAAAIKEKALAPKVKSIEVINHKPGGVMEKFGMDRAGHVYDERKPQYGFKEFWRDLFAKT
ncbi:hypothetical protein MBLNU230_g4359t1 [Neophaeotheca triangularis]